MSPLRGTVEQRRIWKDVRKQLSTSYQLVARTSYLSVINQYLRVSIEHLSSIHQTYTLYINLFHYFKYIRRFQQRPISSNKSDDQTSSTQVLYRSLEF